MMNKRIKELAEQAGFIPDNAPDMNSVLEKFAELILAEVAKVVDYHFMGDAENVKILMKDIKEHFGVE